MYNPTKFNYVPIDRTTVNGSRRYATPDGEKLPSVTTVLDATKSEESKAILENWRKRVGYAKAKEIMSIVHDIGHISTKAPFMHPEV